MTGELIQLIDEPITVEFDNPPLLEKSPHCPDRFIWQDQTHTVEEVLAEWMDTARRGRFARNMREAHARRAMLRGSWGVGRYHFQVRTREGRVFDLYYDRAPRSADDRKGAWYLFGERSPA